MKFLSASAEPFQNSKRKSNVLSISPSEDKLNMTIPRCSNSSGTSSTSQNMNRGRGRA
ncbi:unnamed protein product [Rhodiola kirilowii]